MRRRTNELSVLRWMALPFAVIAGFFASGIACAYIALYLHIWPDPVAGFCVAFTVVVISHHIAPHYKSTTATIIFIIGAIAAYKLFGNWFYPEGYEKAYQPTYLPLATTLLGGLIGVVYSLLITKGRVFRISLLIGNKSNSR